MAKADPKHSIISELVELIGNPKARLVMGVHQNTMYKWTMNANNTDSREPNACAKRLAALIIFLIQTCEWTIDEVIDSVETLDQLIGYYDD